MVHSYQENMITGFKTLLEGYSNFVNFRMIVIIYLLLIFKKECVFAPKLFL